MKKKKTSKLSSMRTSKHCYLKINMKFKRHFFKGIHVSEKIPYNKKKVYSIIIRKHRKPFLYCHKKHMRWSIPVSPARNCIDCMQGVTPSKTYIRLLLLGQNLNWNVHSVPLASWTFNGRPSDWDIGGKYACMEFQLIHIKGKKLTTSTKDISQTNLHETWILRMTRSENLLQHMLLGGPNDQFDQHH